MAQESKAESGREFARDMRRVRESRHITVGDLHDETKIPLGLIEAFEETALFDHPQFNRVYLRSFVRTYANVLGIDPDVALEALEEALSDRYSGSLAVELLGEAPAETEPEDAVEAEPADETEYAAAADQETAAADGEEAETAPQSAAEAEPETAAPEKKKSARRKKKTEEATPAEASETTPAGASEATEEGAPIDEETEREEEASPTFVSTTSEAAAGYGTAEAAADESEWSAQSPPRPKKSTRKTPYRERSGGLDWRWVAGAVAVAVVAVVVWIVLSVTGEGPSDASEMAAGADTAAAAVDTATAQGEPTSPARGPIPAIGDTIDVYIVAAEGKLDPVRVTVDEDLRRPYWIEQGDSMLFQATNRIVVEELLDNVRLNIEGATYPTTRRDEQGRIVINRDSLQANLGALPVEEPAPAEEETATEEEGATE